jgi:apolipoprotein N-acyltransferase
MQRLVSIAEAVLLSEGWIRRLIACGAGAAGALALPPLGLLPALWLSLPIAIWLIDGATGGTSRFSPRPILAAARDGWWFGFGYFVAGLWWIGAAFLVETDEFAWAMPLGIIGLPAALAGFYAFAFALARLVWSHSVWRLFALAFGFAASEYLRHFLFTGFPWNTYGQAMGSWLALAQGAALVGTEGLSTLAVLIFSAPAVVADKRSRPWRPAVLGLVALAMVAAFGLGRLEMNGGIRGGLAAGDVVPGVRLRLVQPNMSQRDKIAETDGMAILQRMFQLSDRSSGPRSTGMADATHIIWPESPFPFLLTSEPNALAEIAKALPATTTLLTGAVRRQDGPGRVTSYYNSLHAFGPKGALLATYDKTHLVPFGEYLPLEQWLTSIGLRRFVHAPGAFSLGQERKLLLLPGLPPVLPLICYEAIFPHEIDATQRPGLFLNITNDAWFGTTFGPYQHLQQARLRAIEFGVPVVRVANTGISAVIDPYGRAHGVLALGTEGIADVALPKALLPPLYTMFVRFLAPSLLLTTFLLAFLAPPVTTWRRRRAGTKKIGEGRLP